MSPDEYQQAWQAQASQTRVTVNAELLLHDAQRNQREFRAKITWNDFVTIGIIAALVPVWIVLGVAVSSPWTWWLMIPAFIWIIGFILVGRARQKPKLNAPGEPLLACAKEALEQVDYQIWSLRNIVWWYLLPMGIPLTAFSIHVTWLKADDWMGMLDGAILIVFFLAISAFIYYLNRLVVRKQYEPRRQELLRLLASLGDEATGEVEGEYPILMAAAPFRCSRRRRILAFLTASVCLAFGIGGILYASNFNQDYPKRAPFTDVQWGKDVPVVKVGDEWHLLYAIDGIPVQDIVAFSQRTYPLKWQKRFAEDLVQVMAVMGHTPGDTVQLEVLSVGQSPVRTTKEVAMTASNRNAVRAAAQEREANEALSAPHRTATAADDPAVPIAELIPRLRAEKKLVGLAAMVVVDGQVVASAVDGEREKGSGVLLTIGDQWHLGSITKSMTATMIGRLVEAGKMQWTDTVGVAFPGHSVHADWKPVTLRQLLTHTSGAPSNFSFLSPSQKPAAGPERTGARRKAVLRMLSKQPAHPPGDEYAYSNAGFTIAGAMAEQVAGTSWEDLMKREVFEPLKLASAGFGPPKSPDETVNQPRGHKVMGWWKIGVDDTADNTPIIGPSGIVHMTLEDLCAYATEHLRGELGTGTLLSPDTFKLLHTPELDNYAYGWVRKNPDDEIPHTVYWHNGSNTMWYALVVFIPETNMVVAVTSNDGDIKPAEDAAWKIVRNSVSQAQKASH